MAGTNTQDLLGGVPRSLTSENVGYSVANLDSTLFADRRQTPGSHRIGRYPRTGGVDHPIGVHVDFALGKGDPE